MRKPYRILLSLFCLQHASSFLRNRQRFPPTRCSVRNAKLSTSAGNLQSLSESVRSLRENIETPPESILRAIEKLPANSPVSVGDAAALAGSDLVTARRGLMCLATLTGGELVVTNDGEIVYSYPANFRSILAKRSLGQKIKSLYESAKPLLLFTLRASFGIGLLVSLALVMSTFVFVSTGSSSDDSNDKDRDGRSSRSSSSSFSSGYRLSGSWGIGDPFSMIYYRPYYSYYITPDFVSSSDVASAGRSLTFIESFFSFVFGDGDPNTGNVISYQLSVRLS